MKLFIGNNTDRYGLSVQTALVAAFFLSSTGGALAQTMGDTAAAQVIAGAVAAKAVQKAIQPSDVAAALQTATGQPASPGIQDISEEMPAAAAMPAAPLQQPASSATAQAQAPDAKTSPSPAPVAVAKQGAAPQASAAEMAIVQNEAALHSLDNAKIKKSAIALPDIESEAANIRPLPEKYLVVRKDHAADDTDARLTAARIALSRGQNQAALELFNDLYRESPLDERVSMGRAVAFQKLGQTDEALAAYEAALARNPKNVEALTNMLGLLQGQDPDTAIEKLQQMRGLYPANADVTAQLGTVYGTAGDYENALRYLDMADALKPENPNILYNKAVVYDRMGKATQAAELYRKIVLMASNGTLGQSFPVETVKKRLATIR
jgi:tetratricopeptide (TPR) repeat protein